MSPSTRSLTNGVCMCVFSPDIWSFFFVFGFLGLKTPQVLAVKKKKNTHSLRQRVDRDLQNTSAKIQHLCQKRREHSGFCAENILNSRSCPLLLSFSIGSTLGDRYALVLALRSQIFEHVRKRFVGVPWGTWNWLRKKKRKKKGSSYGKAWPIMTFLKACSRWGHVLVASTNPRSWTK